MKARKTLALLLALTMVPALCAAPAAWAAEEKTELIVFAAASMTETLTELKAKYEAANPGVTITYNFDSSGTLKTQIQEGADCDLFISAAPKQMNALDASKDKDANPDGLDFVLEGSRLNLLENKVALVVPEGNPKKIESFDGLVELLKAGHVFFAMGNSDVPVGQYTQKILNYYELKEEDLAKAGLITYGSNVKEVTTQVKEASVDCGVVYGTDAFSAGLEVVDTATKEMCGQVIYPAAVMKNSAHPAEAQAFLDYLSSPEAMAIFEAVGFAPVGDTVPAAEAAETEKVELVVFAAASMTETLTQIQELYQTSHPNVTLVYNFDSSGTLKTQIQEGAVCDVFISAGQKQMNQLDITASTDINTEGLDFVLEGSRLNLLENKVVLVVPDGNPGKINSFDDLAAALKK